MIFQSLQYSIDYQEWKNKMKFELLAKKPNGTWQHISDFPNVVDANYCGQHLPMRTGKYIGYRVKKKT